MLTVLCTLLVLWPGYSEFEPAARAQESASRDPGHAAVAPPRGMPLADPVLHKDAVLEAGRTTVWQEQGKQWLLLEGNVQIQMGAYGFRAQRAVARIHEQIDRNTIVRHLWVYLDQVKRTQRAGPVWAEAPRLLVTISTRGKIDLHTDLMISGTAADAIFVGEARGRFDRYWTSINLATLPVPAGPPLIDPRFEQQRITRRAQVRQDAMARSGVQQMVEALPDRWERPSATLAPGQEHPGGPVFLEPVPPRTDLVSAASVIALNWDHAVVRDISDNRSVVVLIGNVNVVRYTPGASGEGISLTADKVVLFLSKKVESVAQNFEAGDIEGVYLEDNVVATNGTVTIRAPRVFFDLATDRAVVLEAVMYAYDVRRKTPLYVRAQTLRQESQRSWSADQAILTTSEFAEPHMAIAAGRITIQQDEAGDGAQGFKYTAHDTTLRMGKMPVFYWPTISGRGDRWPLRRVRFGGASKTGIALQTRWDVFGLMGWEPVDGLDVTADFDWRGDHGGAVGLNVDYDQPSFNGKFESYLVVEDEGEDSLARRQDINFNDDQRGFVLWRHRHELSPDTEVSVEAAYVSDPTFLEEFYRKYVESGKDFELSVYVKHQEDDWALTLLGSASLNNFTPQLTTLQSPGYTVDKLPELGYYRIGTNLGENAITYFSETRVSRMKIQTGKDSPAERGLLDSISEAVFGIPDASVSFESVLLAAGVPTDYRNRFDSRHEAQMPMQLSLGNLPLDVTPYIAGRVTAYDKDFSEFGSEKDNTRYMGQAGVYLQTRIHSTNDTIENPFLDLHRMRHIIEPSIHAWWTGSSYDPENVPVYDADVEALTEGFGIAFGVRNIWQTQRGGPGRWRSVDWLIVDTEFILRSDDADVTARLPRYIRYRPEFSRGGDHLHTEIAWMVTDALAVAGDVTYSVETDEVEQWRIGLSLEQTPRLRFFIDFQNVAAFPERLLTYGLTYELTTLYSIGLRHRIDFGESESRRISLSIIRRLPHFKLVLEASIDDVEDDSAIGFVLVPDIAGGAGGRLVRDVGLFN